MGALLGIFLDPTVQRLLLKGGLALGGYLIHNGTVPIPHFFYDLMNDPGLLTSLGALVIPTHSKAVVEKIVDKAVVEKVITLPPAA